MKPFQNSNIILNIVVYCTEELYMKNIILPAQQQKKRPYKVSLSTEVYNFSFSTLEDPGAFVL